MQINGALFNQQNVYRLYSLKIKLLILFMLDIWQKDAMRKEKDSFPPSQVSDILSFYSWLIDKLIHFSTFST